MIKQIAITTTFFFCLNGLFGQTNDPIWDIGTKWTYELSEVNGESITSYVVNEITDTFNISNMKLYAVESTPAYTGIQYFYYKDGKVFNYNTFTELLVLLYDFSTETNYNVNYRPICDGHFPYDSLWYKQYTIGMDSITDFEMPDGTFQNVQHVSIFDTLIDGLDTLILNDSNRSILNNIGFLQGSYHHTHDWEIGMYICDDGANFVNQLRCFENDTVSYNFVGYPCDSTWTLSSVDPIADRNKINLFPNPTSELINISGIDIDLNYEIYSSSGMLLEQSKSQNKTIHLKEEGLNIIRFYLNGSWIYRRIIKLDN